MDRPPLIVLTGPTASGKGSVAFELARRTAAEIVSLDSMKLYREMDIGTGKPPPENRSRVRYHLLDIVSPSRHFSTGDYLPLLEDTLRDLERRECRAIVCGGTALYLKGFLYGFGRLPRADWTFRQRLIDEARETGPEVLHDRLARVDPAAARKILPRDTRRIVRALEVYERTGRPVSDEWRWESAETRHSVRLFGIDWDRSRLYERVDRRVLGMVERGLFEEARRLMRRVPPLSRSARQSIGYKEIFAAEEARRDEAEVIETIQRNTRRFVKRQMTWMRKLPVEWIPAGSDFAPEVVADEILRRLG